MSNNIHHDIDSSINILDNIDRVLKIDSEGHVVPTTNHIIDKFTVPYNKIKYAGPKIYSGLPILLSLILCIINICVGYNIIPISIPIFLTVLGFLLFIYIAYINYKLLEDDDATNKLIRIAINAYHMSILHHIMVFIDPEVMDYGTKEEYISNNRKGAYLYIFSLYTSIFVKLCSKEFSILYMNYIIDSMCDEKVFLAIMKKHKKMLDDGEDIHSK